MRDIAIIATRGEKGKINAIVGWALKGKDTSPLQPDTLYAIREVMGEIVLTPIGKVQDTMWRYSLMDIMESPHHYLKLDKPQAP